MERFGEVSSDASEDDYDYLPDIDEVNNGEDVNSSARNVRAFSSDQEASRGDLESEDSSGQPSPQQPEANSDSNYSLPSVGGQQEVIVEEDSVSLPGRRESERESEDSLLSVGNQNGDGESQDENETVNNGPVSGFRVRMGDDGEEIFEFASNSEGLSSDSSDDEDFIPWNEQIGVEPAVEFAIPGSIIASIAGRVNQRRTSSSQVATPGTSGLSPRRPQQRRPPNQNPRRRPRKKGRKRRAKAVKPRKKTIPKLPRSPPKPLGPLQILEDCDGNDDHKEYLKRIANSTKCKLYINFKDGCLGESNNSNTTKDELPTDLEVDCSVVQRTDGATQPEEYNNFATVSNKSGSEPTEETQNSQSQSRGGYKIGEVQFDRCGTQRWDWKSKTELVEANPDIVELIFHVSQQPSASILHMKTKRQLSEEEAAEHPPPKLLKKDSGRQLKYIVTKHYFYHVDPVCVPFDMFSNRALGNRRTFALDFNHFDFARQCFILDVVLLDTAILNEHEIHEIPMLKFQPMQDVFANFLGVAPPPAFSESETRQKEDIQWFYGQIRKFHQREELPASDIPLQPAALKPTLRNYQKDAVQWMLYREGCLDHCEAHSTTSYLNKTDLINTFLNKMYIPIELTTHVSSGVGAKKQAFYNPYTAYICWKRPKVPPLPSGGILCDEMGLGKTVETLCVILLNEKQIPEHLQEFFGDQTKEKVEECSEAESSQTPSSDSNTTDTEEDESLLNRKRKKASKGNRKKRSRPTKTVSCGGNRDIGKRRRRAPSPCEFVAADEDDVQERLTPTKKVTVIDAMRQKCNSNRAVSKKRKSSTDKPGSTFEALKVMYDSALNEYKYAEMARSMPKFHGKFYEVEIESRAFFECVCGETDEGYRKAEIVQCSYCMSSQHADCVGFDDGLRTLFKTINKSYLCPHCEALEPPFETKSTLIITPQSISHQWIKEIQRHVQNHRLNILFYKGVSTHGYMSPAKLARYDIVITTYNVLSTELDYVDLPHCNSADGRRFRNAKRFLTIPSPLPNVLWWRVCLDEAQMVEGINTKMSMMAMKFRAVHRWCVTGTPMNKGLQDLFGLFVFLNVSPISYDIWWNYLVRDPFFMKDTSLLYELFGQMIWRNGKQDVLDQLGIPPQTEVIHWLDFSPVEIHFYKQQFEICSVKILDKINRLQRQTSDMDIPNMRLSSLDRFTLHGLLAPFLELRQACCHPQMVKGQLISLQKGTLTMEELLDRLIKKTHLQCHEDHRLIVSALNGMAGLQIIMNDWKDAADKYRQVLQSAEKHKEHFQTDSLQLLHTMENLAEILDGNFSGIPFTLRDESLRSEADLVRQKYMKKYSDAIKSAQEAVSSLSQAVDDIGDQFTMRQESWWMAVLKRAQRGQKIDSLIQTLKQDLLDVTKKNIKTSGSLANKFHDRYGLEMLLTKNIPEMDQLRDAVLESLKELQNSDPSTFVENAIRCHLRQKSNSYYNDSNEEFEKCTLCSDHDSFLFYESVIFKADTKDKISRTGRNYQQRKLLGEMADELPETARRELLQQEAEDLKATTEHVQLINEELRRGTWGDSETEVILKGLLRFARVNKLDEKILENGNVHIKYLEAVKKEFRYLRILWRRIYDQVSGLDELSQATTRLIAVTGGDTQRQERPGPSKKLKQLSSGIVEKSLKIQNIHVIAHHEIEPRMAQLQTDYATGHESLATHLGQLLYLKNLKRNGYGRKGAANTDDCPICSTQLGKQWTVLRCGHSYCSDCVKKMCPNALHSFLCPLCRHSMKFADVSFVDTTENERDMGGLGAAFGGTSSQPASAKVKEVKGSHSTKVEAIVQTLLQLQETRPGEKCIIFSSWSDVLDIVAKALEQNDILYSLLNQPGRSFQGNLDKFKQRDDIQVLLMPLTSGSKGLNIVEATHVMLIEPILNLASELQAIGRVHRIGQTRPTFVHRFYVRKTIEENLFQVLKGHDVSADEEGSLTVQDLRSLVSSSKASATANEAETIEVL